MCKVFILTNMTQIDDLETTVNTIAKHISDDEKDGFGYAISTTDKQLFGERTTEPKNFQSSFNKLIPDVPFIKPIGYNRFGIYSPEKMCSGIFHGRTSTNHKTLINTHPINKNGWSLIHNGVVNNTGPKYDMHTTNDTEHLVHYLSTSGVSSIEKHLTGYYALGAFDPQCNLHILRDSIAPLYFAKIVSINSYVFATTKNLIEEVCQDLDLDFSIICEMRDDTYLIYNQENELIHSQSIKSRGYTDREAQHASKSLKTNLSSLSGHYSSRESVYDFNTSLDEQAFSPDELKFLSEVNTCGDHTYTFLTYHKELMTPDEFFDLDDNEKLYCTVIRPDGTIVDPQNYDSETIFDGMINSDNQFNYKVG